MDRNSVKNLLIVECEQQINVSKEVIQWNYLDGEHLEVVHQGYKNVKVLLEDGQFSLMTTKLKAPLIPALYLESSVIVSMIDPNTQVTFAKILGTWSKTTIRTVEVSPDACKISMRYEYYLNGWRKLLRPILKRNIAKWNQAVWDEDLPLKLRRQAVLDWGFQDFKGLPRDFEERSLNRFQSELSMPQLRPRNSPIGDHPLLLRNGRRVKIRDPKQSGPQIEKE